jgi:hypothetical protein
MASPKEKVPAVPPGAPDPLASLVDELGAIDKTLQPFRTLIAREEGLRKQIRSAHDGAIFPPDREIRVEGATYAVILSPRALVKSINIKSLIRAIGAKAFCAFASCTLGQLESNCPDLPVGIVTSANTGSRSLKIFGV